MRTDGCGSKTAAPEIFRDGVVRVGCGDKTSHGQPHLCSEQSCGEVSVIAARNDDSGTLPAGGFHPLRPTVEVVKRLGNPAQDIDRIGRGHPLLPPEIRIRENIFDDPLAVVECSLHFQRENVASQRSHLALLQAADLSVRIQDDHFNPFDAVEAVRYRTARVAGCRGQDDCFPCRPVQFPQCMSHKTGPDIFECEGRPVE